MMSIIKIKTNMRKDIDAAINSMIDINEKPKTLVLNKKNHKLLYDELSSNYLTNVSIVYSFKYMYMGVRVVIDADVFLKRRLFDNDFVI